MQLLHGTGSLAPQRSRLGRKLHANNNQAPCLRGSLTRTHAVVTPPPPVASSASLDDATSPRGARGLASRSREDPCPVKLVMDVVVQQAKEMAPGNPTATKQLQQARAEEIKQQAAAAVDAYDEMMNNAGPRPIDKYLYLRNLLVSSPSTYYKMMLAHTQDVLPYIYTPTVGQACQEYHTLPLATRGLYISLNDRGSILAKLRSWPKQEVRVIVATDGERILGLGDLGANGMGISEGKIELYTAAAGVDPRVSLPICLDVGTNNVKLRDDPAYRGLRQARPDKPEYDAFIKEFMDALRVWQPHLLLQYEDFGNTNAFRVLDNYRNNFCCFNDDIQGTASITLAALLSALRVKHESLSRQRILFLGAGEAATGIASLIAYHTHSREGISIEEARRRCYLIDSKGLVCASRKDLQHHKIPFAHDVPFQATLQEVVESLKPTVLVGVAASPGAFDEKVLKAMAAENERPIIMPLSNPTSLSECTYEDAWKHTGGRVLFASGSPFNTITDKNFVVHYPAQANNAYIFPAVGHAAVLTRASIIDDEMFALAAEVLSRMSSIPEMETGRLFPAFANIREVSAHIMAAVARYMVGAGIGQVPDGWNPTGDWVQLARNAMWGKPNSKL